MKSLRSKTSNVFLAKVWGPVLFLVCAIGITGGNPLGRNFFFFAPFVIAAFFGLSVAVVKIRDGQLQYKRLFKWRVIAPHKVIDVRLEIPPVIGSIRCDSFLFPWGRLYFALDENADWNIAREGKYSLIESILRLRRAAAEDGNDQEINSAQSVSKLSPAIAIAGAVLYGVVRIIFFRLGMFEVPSSALTSVPPLLEFLYRMSHLFGNGIVQSFLFGIFAFFAVRRRGKRDGWIFVLLSGFSFPHICLLFYSLAANLVR